MEEFKRNLELDFHYDLLVYSGISNKIEWEINHGWEDRTEILSYVVDRYINEIVISGASLLEKLEEYKVFASEKYGSGNKVC